jgi:hypothetical protein
MLPNDARVKAGSHFWAFPYWEHRGFPLHDLEVEEVAVDQNGEHEVVIITRVSERESEGDRECAVIPCPGNS